MFKISRVKQRLIIDLPRYAVSIWLRRGLWMRFVSEKDGRPWVQAGPLEIVPVNRRDHGDV